MSIAFARQLRPALLDDLGLIAALGSFIDGMKERTNLPIKLTTFPELQDLDVRKRTVFYRVAQEALTNVVRHAEAKMIQVVFKNRCKTVLMEIRDNGKSFDVQYVLLAKGKKHLGVLGMRERVEMVGGIFKIESSAGTVLSSPQRFLFPASRHDENEMNEGITVLLAEDHVVVREGLRILIEADGDIKVVGEAITGREAVLMTKKLHPDVVVMDIAMPLLNGIQATSKS